MYRRILVALDESQLSQQAFQHSLSLAKAFNSELQLINVISPLEAEYQSTVSFAGGGYYSNGMKNIQDDTTEAKKLTVENRLDFLQSLVEQATQVGVSAEFVQEIGQPEHQICQSAKNWEADLLVIGSHGRTGLSELFQGSVSNYVSRHVPCAVLLVHQQI